MNFSCSAFDKEKIARSSEKSSTFMGVYPSMDILSFPISSLVSFSTDGMSCINRLKILYLRYPFYLVL